MNKKMKKMYEVPALTVVSFKAERGYAVSGSEGILSKRSGYSYENSDDDNDGNNSNQEWF